MVSSVVEMASESIESTVRAPWRIEQTARRLGNYRWTEMKLFEALGSWVATVPELDVKVHLAAHCHHHAWHADLWRERLPELRELEPERLTVAANPAMERFIDAMTEAEAPELTIEKLVGVYRVLVPRFIAAYSYHRNNTSAITDAPTIRSLDFILHDEIADWCDGEMLLQRLITTPDHVERAAVRQSRLEALMVEAGGIAGPDSVGPATADSTGTTAAARA